MHFSRDKDINQLVQDLIRLGWTYSKGRHYKLYAPDGSGVVIVPFTPSDRRAFQNFRRDVRHRLRGHAEDYRHARLEMMP